MGTLLCVFHPAGCISTSIAKATLGDLFTALTSRVLSSVQWLLSAAGTVLTSAAEPATVVRGASQEFKVLLVLSPVLMMIGLLVSTLQALRHGDTASLWRTYLGVAPACVLGIVLARPMATLILDAVNELSSTASGTLGQHVAPITSAFTNLEGSTPGFGLFLLATGIVVGTWLLWCELIVRIVVLTLLLVLVPVIVPLSTFPSLRRLGWRLAETFLAVASSKFLIAITLSLGFDELTGSSATQIITGAVTLVLATFSPFILLRLIPFIEQSSMHNLEGIRQRFTRAATNAPSSPAATAARALLPDAPMPGPTPRPDDMGLGVWQETADFEPPAYTGVKLPAPVGEPRLRGGHVAYQQDDMGPVVGWHFDE
jgi:hypothetical protein